MIPSLLSEETLDWDALKEQITADLEKKGMI